MSWLPALAGRAFPCQPRTRDMQRGVFWLRITQDHRCCCFQPALSPADLRALCTWLIQGTEPQHGTVTERSWRLCAQQSSGARGEASWTGCIRHFGCVIFEAAGAGLPGQQPRLPVLAVCACTQTWFHCQTVAKAKQARGAAVGAWHCTSLSY